MALNGTMQENVITMLAYDDDNGRIIHGLVKPDLFEGHYRLIAEYCIKYWDQYGQAPGTHTADLIAPILESPSDRRSKPLRAILINMAELAGEGINTKYVINELSKFVRLQKLKAGVLRSAEQIDRQQEMAIEDVEQIWNDLLHVRESTFDIGMRLTDLDRLTAYLDTTFDEFTFGVPALDTANFVPYRGAVTVIVGSTGAGKTWCLLNVAKEAFKARKKVLIVEMELSEELTTQRFYQALFSVPKRPEEISLTHLELDDDGTLSDISVDTSVKPAFTFASPILQDELMSRINHLGARRFDNVIIKRYPPRHLTPSILRGYLDTLEIVEGFLPDLIILDYIGIMKTDADNHRITLGRTFEEIRAISIERNAAMIVGHQGSKEGARSGTVRAIHGAEDWSIIGTADQVVTISKTDVEKSFGLARLYVDKGRNEADGFEVLITQNYSIGQFCIQSMRMPKSYDEVRDDFVDRMGYDDDDD